MFDSLNAGYIPICIIVVVFAWLIAKVDIVGIRVVLTLVIPVAISMAYFFLPRFLDLFRPLKFGEDPWVGWGFIASATWSIVAVPASIISVIVFVRIRRRDKHGN
jgi:uncharacterized membrane protein (DUF106 family)